VDRLTLSHCDFRGLSGWAQATTARRFSDAAAQATPRIGLRRLVAGKNPG